MSFWKRLFGVGEGPSVHRPLLATLQPTLPDQEERDDIKASVGICSEATAIFVWNADVMPTSYGRVAQDALSSAFRIALRPNPAEVLSLEARAGDVLGPNPIGERLRSFLMSVNAEPANVDAEIRTSIRTGTAVDYSPYVLVVNAESDGIQLAHQQLVGQQVVGYLGVISISPPTSLLSVESQLSLPLASLQISSGRPELSDPELIQLLAQAEKESDKATTVALCDQILANNPDCSDGHNLRGWALKELNRIDEAESAYRRAIEIDPKHAAALWNLSYIVGSKRRDYRDAVLLIDRVIALKPTFLQRAISERARYASLADETEQLRHHVGQEKSAMDIMSTTNPATTSTAAAEITIHDAAKSGDLEEVEAQLKNNLDLLFVKDKNGMTPLHSAANAGKAEVVEVLLVNNAFVDAKEINGLTPLHMAARHNHSHVVKLLLENKADVNARNNYGFTPLHAAASASWSSDCVELLLVSGAEVNARDKDGITPLHLAAADGKDRAAKLILAKGGDVNAQDKDGYSPLHWAARRSKFETMTLLLDSGADVNTKSEKGETPLHLGAENCSEETMKRLLAKKADVNAQDKDGRTPLHMVANSAFTKLASLLLANGADVNATDKIGIKPLRIATSRRIGGKADVDTEMVELLLHHSGHE